MDGKDQIIMPIKILMILIQGVLEGENGGNILKMKHKQLGIK